MTVEQLAELGRRMRDAQNRYFRRGRTPSALQEARKLEEEFDPAVATVLEPPPADLFTRWGASG